MTTIILRYNPFRAVTTLTVDERQTHLNCFGTGEGQVLSGWKHDFFPQLIKKLNKGPGSSVAVIFYGLKDDYDELLPAYTEYSEKNKDIIIHFEYGTQPPITLAEKDAAVQTLFEKAQSESALDALKTPEFSAKVAAVRNNQSPEFKYFEPPKKLFRIVSDYRKLFDTLELYSHLDKVLAEKKTALEEVITEEEAKKTLAMEISANDIDKLDRKINASQQEVIEVVFQKNMTEWQDKLTPDCSGKTGDYCLNCVVAESVDDAGYFWCGKYKSAFRIDKVRSMLDSFYEVVDRDIKNVSSTLEKLKTAPDALAKHLKTNINKQIEDYVSCLSEYVSSFPDTPTLASFGVCDDVKILADKLNINIKEELEKPLKKDNMKWVCPVCGYVCIGEKPDRECPQCRAPSSRFTQQEADGGQANDNSIGGATLPYLFAAVAIGGVLGRREQRGGGTDTERTTIFDNAETIAKEKGVEIKNYFSSELDKINSILMEKNNSERERRQKLLEAAKNTEDSNLHEAFEKEIAVVQNQLAWLSEYTGELDRVLEV